MKTESRIYLKEALFDLMYLLDFKNEKTDLFYCQKIQEILNRVTELEEDF